MTGSWQRSYTALATAHAMPVVGVSNVGPIAAGPWQGRKCIGCSLVIGLDGQVVAQAAETGGGDRGRAETGGES